MQILANELYFPIMAQSLKHMKQHSQHVEKQELWSDTVGSGNVALWFSKNKIKLFQG